MAVISCNCWPNKKTPWERGFFLSWFNYHKWQTNATVDNIRGSFSVFKGKKMGRELSESLPTSVLFEIKVTKIIEEISSRVQVQVVRVRHFFLLHR